MNAFMVTVDETSPEGEMVGDRPSSREIWMPHETG